MSLRVITPKVTIICLNLRTIICLYEERGKKFGASGFFQGTKPVAKPVAAPHSPWILPMMPVRPCKLLIG